MTLRAFLPLLSLPLLATAAPALAQEAEVIAPPPPALFPTMGPDGAATQLGGQLTMLTDEGEIGLKRLDLVGQYVNARGHGGYANIAASFGDEYSHLGSLEVGGLVVLPSGDGVAITVRGGLVLPTSGTGGGDDEALGWLSHYLATLLSRPSDVAAAAPDTTLLRLAVSPSLRRGNLIARADLGIDAALDEDSDGALLHVDLGVGYHTGRAAVVAELSTIAGTEDLGEPIHLFAISGQLVAGPTTPYVTISKPMGVRFFEDELDTTNVVVGMRGRL